MRALAAAKNAGFGIYKANLATRIASSVTLNKEVSKELSNYIQKAL